MVLGLALLMGCQQPFDVVEDQKPEEGRFFDWIWDAVSVGLGIKNASENLSRGDVGAAAVDAAGVVVDTVAAAIPGVPGGVGTARAATRAAGDVAANAARVADARSVEIGPRLPQDIRVNPTPPDRLSLDRPISRNREQNEHAMQEARRLEREGWGDVRVNQQQVNAAGQRVGINRPDIQATAPDALGGQRHYFEYDRPGSNRGPEHRQRTLGNDRTGVSILEERL